MIVNVDLFKFPIPFKQIYLCEKQTIERMHSCRGQSNRHLLGQARLNDRMTVIIICYLLTSMVMLKSDQSISRNIMYLCKGKQRKDWLLRATEKIRQFLMNQLDEQKMWVSEDDLENVNQIYDLEIKEQTQMSMTFQQLRQYFKKGLIKKKLRNYVQRITICSSIEECELISKSQKLNSNQKKKGIFVILQIKEYIYHKVAVKQFNHYWQNVKDPYLMIDPNINNTMFSWICRHLQYLFIETNDLEGLLEDHLSLTISDVVVYRAGLEISKLNKFFNFRFDNRAREKALKKGAQNTSKSKKEKVKVGKEDRMQSLQQINLNKQGERQIIIKRQVDRRRKSAWHVQSTDRMINDLAKQKIKFLQTQLNHRRGDPAYLPVAGTQLGVDQQKNLKCYTLFNMQLINYFLNYLLIHEFKETGDVPDAQFSADKYPLDISKKSFLNIGMLSKFRIILKGIVSKFPPIVNNRQLSTFYLQQVLHFYQKVIVWEKMFLKVSEEATNNSPHSKFSIFRYRVDFEAGEGEASLLKRREYHMKLASFDQKVILELLEEGTKSICCFQNQGLYFDYYEQIFKPTRFSNMTLEYRCPTVNAKLMKSATIGMIINSTPNDQDLHINSDRSSLHHEMSDLQNKRYDKEHYSQIIRSYGVLIHDLCEIVPDGLVVYFPTRDILRQCRAEWEVRENIYERICQKKKVFEEGVWAENNQANLVKYRKLCDVGRGAVFFVSAHSDFGRDTTFFGHYSKCVVFVGVPYFQINVEIDYKINQLKLKEIFRFKMAMRVVSRCLSNCINNPAEVKVVIFADDSFGKNDIRKKWFPFIEDGNLNTSTIIEQVARINSKTSKALAIREQLQMGLSQASNLRRIASSSSFRN